MRRLILLLLLMPFFSHFSKATNFTLSGQASTWAFLSDESQIGMRYIPELGISNTLFKEQSIDASISLNSFTWFPVNSLKDINNNIDLDIYRLWLRYSTAQLELRIGLQKINFGQAKILRTLMWFDRLDIRDPLQLTDGVYGLLGRYYFLNNANIWLWGLYGNNGLKGLEMFETDDEQVEFGGRCQVPLFKGELAFSFNHRDLDRADWESKMSTPIFDGLENRYAIDGNWDIGIGIWFEMLVSEIMTNEKELLWQELLTIGTDYTFGIGPGIHLLCEHFIYSFGAEIDKTNNTSKFSALLIDFSISMLDRLSAIGYYDWEEEKVYTYIGLRRTYDNWQINLLGFSGSQNPMDKKNKNNTFSGKGVQCMVTYNH